MKSSPLALVLMALVKVYRAIPKRGGSCRFYPSCSAYALQALAENGALRGGWLALRRLGRCQPFHPGGIDEVPHRRTPMNALHTPQ